MNNKGGWVSSVRDSKASGIKLEKQIRERIALRMSQGWDLEKIGSLTVWRMFGHFYSIKDGVLYVKMNGGNEAFGGAR